MRDEGDIRAWSARREDALEALASEIPTSAARHTRATFATLESSGRAARDFITRFGPPALVMRTPAFRSGP
jgi:hypothetical protein